MIVQLQRPLRVTPRRRLLGTLSKGYRQRVGLADALVADPKVLILDEPTSGLDPLQIRETLNTIRGLAGTHTVLLSTHILNEVEASCDRVIIISRGTIRWDGQLSRLAEQVPVLVMEVRGPADGMRHRFNASAAATSILSAMSFGIVAARIWPRSWVTHTTVTEPRATSTGGDTFSFRNRNA